jgi:hypothetical protein
VTEQRQAEGVNLEKRQRFDTAMNRRGRDPCWVVLPRGVSSTGRCSFVLRCLYHLTEHRRRVIVYGPDSLVGPCPRA